MHIPLRKSEEFHINVSSFLSQYTFNSSPHISSGEEKKEWWHEGEKEWWRRGVEGCAFPYTPRKRRNGDTRERRKDEEKPRLVVRRGGVEAREWVNEG